MVRGEGDSQADRRLIRPTAPRGVDGTGGLAAPRPVANQPARPPGHPRPLMVDTTEAGVSAEVGGQQLLAIRESSAEAMRNVIAKLRGDGELPTPLAITAPVRGQGTTFVSRAVAAVLAHDHSAAVCWVDLNWWK